MINHQDRLDRVFTALADGNRRAIIDRLSKGEQSVTNLQAPLGISLPATMQHLGILEEAGLVTTRKIGRVRTCTLDTSTLGKAEQWINQRRQFWNERLDTLGAFLAKTTELKKGK